MHQAQSDVEQAREIIRYFMQHPQASDDLQGIARWRLLQLRVHRQVQEVQSALALLVSMKLLNEQYTPSVGKRYCLNLAKLTESEDFVNHGNGNGR